MLGLPPSLRASTSIFNRPCTATGQWETWRKPRGVSMVYIMCIGGGAGGGYGFSGIAGSARGGGGGGGSSGAGIVIVQAAFLPDIMFVQVGAGGVGLGGGAGPAPSGVLSYVGIAPDPAVQNLIAVSSSVAPVGGGVGTAGAGGAGGAGGTSPGISTMPLAGLGNFYLIAGQLGAAGGVSAGGVGNPIGISSQGFTQGGSGGAGTTAADFAGGSFTDSGDYLSEQRPATPAAGSAGFGSGGPMIWKPFFSFGGGGGSSSNAGAGASAGNGSYGSGGGGGGAGQSIGRGGDGGSGIVIITSW